MKKYLAVIDTNVIVSALISKQKDSATVKVIADIFNGCVIPLYHKDILCEYNEVLHRPKFHLEDETIRQFIGAIEQIGIEVFPSPTREMLPDEDDLIFYEVTMEKRPENSYLITGNIRHYPQRAFIVTPAEFIEIIEQNK